VQALAKDLPWKLKEPRVLEILQAVSIFDLLQETHVILFASCFFSAFISTSKITEFLW